MFTCYDEYLDYQDHWASWARAQEEAYWQQQEQEAMWEQWCYQHGQYELPHEYYLDRRCPPDWTPTIQPVVLTHD